MGSGAINFIYLPEHLVGNFRSSAEVYIEPILRWSPMACRTTQRIERPQRAYCNALTGVLSVPLLTCQPAHGQVSGQALQLDGLDGFNMLDAVAPDWVWRL